MKGMICLLSNYLTLILISILCIIFIIIASIILILVIHKKSQEKTLSEEMADNLAASNNSKTMGEFVIFIKEYKPTLYSTQGDFYE